ncbi:MAG: MFS transporter [Antricoccus sp.]
MSRAAIDPEDVRAPATKGQVVAWASWDWGSAAFNAVLTTFVFSVYLTTSVGADLPGDTSATTWLSWAIGIAGFFVAVLAPVMGQRSDAAGHRRRSLAIWTTLVVLASFGLFFVQNNYHYLWFGLVLLAFGTVCFELASVPYYAMLRQVSTPSNIGRISGLGWGAGYLGGIFLLLFCYTGFIVGDGPTRGFFGVSTENGFNIRIIALLAAVWFAVFALPVFFKVPEIHGAPEATRRKNFFASYKDLWLNLKDLYQSDRDVLRFLIASAFFRDGLAAIFTFGAVLASTVYGIPAGDVLIFGVAANIVSAIGAFTAGRFDDKFGPKPVIVLCLTGLIITAIILLFVSGPTMFWIFGLILTLFVGPAQASARSYVARIAPLGREGQIFGLYQTTGRAVSFIAPTLFGLFITIFHADRAGIVGIILVLVVGLGLLLRVRPARDKALADHEVDAQSP